MLNVVAALIWNENRFMICRRPSHKARGGLWEFPGGKIESGETAENALIRECKEELNITVSVGDIFMETEHAYPDVTVHLILFNAEIMQGIPQLLEHTEMRWINADMTDGFAFCPADVPILEKLKTIASANIDN